MASTPKAMQLKERGNQMFAEHRFNEAIEFYTSALVVSEMVLDCVCVCVCASDFVCMCARACK